MSTRAVALEIVQDLTAESFILAFRRFVADHGKPRLITSDNASTFTLASKVLNSCWDPTKLHPDIRAYLNAEGMRWIFIPANSPWRGGFYERLVASVKKAFSHGAGRRVLEYQEALTTIKEVAGILNQRPLTYLYDDDTGMVILRPADLIRPENNPPTGVCFGDDGHSDDETYYPRLLDSQAKAKRWYKS
ncbi:Integrase core domain containing protein [Aphelenchoides avenae]|nr:Integrase core domain containing protein [Aphelenchus avenae]